MIIIWRVNRKNFFREKEKSFMKEYKIKPLLTGAGQLKIRMM